MAAPKTSLQKMPGYSNVGGANSVIRTVDMVQPICPQSKIPMERGTDGKLYPKDMGPDYIDCAKAGGAWWIDCEARGHDPYHTTHIWYTEEPVVDEITGEILRNRRIRHEAVVANFTQVGASLRVDSGQAVRRARKNHGFKLLPEAGYEAVCQMRNCQEPTQKRYTSKNYGAYCSAEHLQLVVANALGVALPLPDVNLNGVEYEKIVRQRAKELREHAAFAVEQEG